MDNSTPRNVNILITSAGSVNAVNVIQALKQEWEWQEEWGNNVEQIPFFLITADADKLAAGLYMGNRYYIIPKADDPKYIPALLRICRKEKIHILMPISDYELPIIANNKKKFEKIGVKMAISEPVIYRQTEDKLETAVLFEMLNIPAPKIYLNKVRFPAIIKPIKGSGAKGVHKVDNKRELDFYKRKDTITQQFVEGKEYTIDGLSDLDGNMLYALPRQRLEIKCGMAIKSITCYNKTMIKYAKKIVESIGLVGAFNIQCIKNGRSIWFLEVNNRFGSGGLPLTIGAGLNIPMDIIRMLIGKPVLPFRHNRYWIYDKISMTRYSDAIIIKKYDKRHY